MTPLPGRALLSRDEARTEDRRLIEGGVPGIVLMENAGRAATEWVLRVFPERLECVHIFGGPGQNGGDAWVLARHLLVRGHRPRVFALGDPTRARGDAALALAALVSQGITPEPLTTLESLAALDVHRLGASLVVDGLFGTGLDRPLEGVAAALVRALDAWPVPRVALDVPSGISADSGHTLGASLRADLTITFHADKRGLHVPHALDRVGRVVVADIGVPAPAPSDACLVGAEALASVTTAASLAAHKATSGRVLVVGGSPGRTGAALLAGWGAMRAGAGLVTLAAREGAREALDAKVVELMTYGIEEPLERGTSALLDVARSMDAVAIGPGAGTDDASQALLRRLGLELPSPTVLDADALRAFAGELEALAAARAPRILTPHPREAARLLGVRTENVEADRFEAAASIARATGQVVVLKGARTITCAVLGGGARFAVSERGTPALGVAGTGDVLAGVLAALLARARAESLEDAFRVAWSGVVAHALAGEAASHGRDRGLVAREVADALPSVLGRSLDVAPLTG